MTGKASRDKGRDYEATIRRYLKTRFSWPVINPAATGHSGADIMVLGLPISIECKNHGTNKMPEWMKQAEEDAGNDYPVVIHKRRGKADPRDQWVTMTAKNFFELLKELDERAPQ